MPRRRRRPVVPSDGSGYMIAAHSLPVCRGDCRLALTRVTRAAAGRSRKPPWLRWLGIRSASSERTRTRTETCRRTGEMIGLPAAHARPAQRYTRQPRIWRIPRRRLPEVSASKVAEVGRVGGSHQETRSRTSSLSTDCMPSRLDPFATLRQSGVSLASRSEVRAGAPSLAQERHRIRQRWPILRYFESICLPTGH
jgi:hypothetical protein